MKLLIIMMNFLLMTMNIIMKNYILCHDVDILCDNGKLIDLIVRKRLNSELPNEDPEIINETKNLKHKKL